MNHSEQIPAIPPSPEAGSPRPFWSVMIPTYRPDKAYLRQALESVLEQAPSPNHMQIEVVDDCSSGVDVAALVNSIAGGRVAVSSTPRNLGLAGCWNTCIERARGEWVHIFHQDDIVIPGFYERLQGLVMQFPQVGMAYCRFATVDSTGHWQGLGPLEQTNSGVIENWLDRIITGYHVECPAVVVKRSVYEQLGGFTGQLNFALDLEMWIRIAVKYKVVYEPSILACYRRHEESETGRMEMSGSNMMDIARAFDICRGYLPPESADELIARGKEFWANVTLMVAGNAYAADKLDACAAQLNAVLALCNQGTIRKRRLKLAARLFLKRAIGLKLLEVIRRRHAKK